MKKLTMEQVKENNKKAGRYYFSPDTMRFFKSRIESELFKQKYFITSEQHGDWSPRLFSIREYDPKTHKISTVGDFQRYKSKEKAIQIIAGLK